ncbi:MAG: NAD(P)-dependent oxidoreductase [Castellaniella sp.]
MKRIGIIGLGNMGGGMATTLQARGFHVMGHDASADVQARIAAQGIPLCGSAGALAREAQAIILSLPNSAIVEAVVLGPDGILAHAAPGSLIIDTSTAHPDSTRRIARDARDAGIGFIDAPVSGGAQAAAQGTLTMMLGGDTDTLARAEPILDALSAKRVHVGPAGAGHTAKLLNNLLCGAHLILAGEAARAARALGMDAEKIFEGINAGSGRSAVTEVNFPRWVFSETFDSGFTMALMRKDIGLAQSLLASLGLDDYPLSTQCTQLWHDSSRRLGDDLDFNRITDFTASQPGREHQ